MTFTPKAWKNKNEAGAQEFLAHEVIDIEERVTAYTDGKLQEGKTTGTGDLLGVYATPTPTMMDLRIGTAGSPDTTPKPALHVSRTLSVAEAEFSGDGADVLPAISGVCKAASTSQGQSIGVLGVGITDAKYAGASSNSDGVGGYFVGKATSTASNSRAGIGIFAAGRRESETGATTGAEIVSINETEKEGKFESTGASDTKALWIHCTGKKNSGVGIQIGKTERSFVVGLGFNTGSVSSASIWDQGQAQFGLRISSTHAKAAISVKKGSGVVLLGSSTEEAIEAGAIIETPFLRMNETGWHLNGGTPVAIKAAGAETTAALWARLKELGLCT